MLSIAAQPASPSTVTISWQLDEQPSIQQLFQITYESTSSSEIMQRNVSSDESMRDISDLFPGFKYNYEIVAISGSQLSDVDSAMAVQREWSSSLAGEL